MSVAREATGSWMTSPRSRAGSSGVTRDLEEVAAKKVVGVRPLHVGAGVDDHVPVPGRRRIVLVQRRRRVGIALAVGDDLVEREGDATALLAAADVDVRDVRRARLQTGDLQ